MLLAARSSTVLVTALAALLVTSCSSSSNTSQIASPTATVAASVAESVAESAAPISSTSSTPSEASSPASVANPSTTDLSTSIPDAGATTTVDLRPLNPVDEALAKAGTLMAADFGPAWTAFRAAQSGSVDTTSCSYRSDGAVTLVDNGGLQQGPTMELGQSGAFVDSFSIAFPSESLAMEYVGVVSTDVWGACRTKQLQQEAIDRQSGAVVALVTRDAENLHSSGFESFAQFEYTDPDAGVVAELQVSYYRIGRDVIVLAQQSGHLNDADLASLTNDTYTALLAAYARVNALP